MKPVKNTYPSFPYKVGDIIKYIKGGDVFQISRIEYCNNPKCSSLINRNCTGHMLCTQNGVMWHDIKTDFILIESNSTP